MTSAGMATPDGCAHPPPSDIRKRKLRLDIVRNRKLLYRIHKSDQGAIFFGPKPGEKPTYRFDSAKGKFGVLYLGRTFEAAFIETLMRNPARHMVSGDELVTRSVTELYCLRDLRLVKLHGDGLSYHGIDNAISAGRYKECGEWADALWDHPDSPDGIAFASRFDCSQLCLAVFNRDNIKSELEIVPPTRKLWGECDVAIAALLDRYGKSLSPPTTAAL